MVARSLWATLLCFGLGAPARAAELDWCAPIAVRPDQRWFSAQTCEPWWKPDTIARDADFVLGGFRNPSTSSVSHTGVSCLGVHDQQTSRAYNDDLRARAAAQGRSLVILHMSRPDLVNREEASSPGFDAGFLIESAFPLDEETAFFDLDTTPSCVCGCEFHDAGGPALVRDGPGERLRDFIDASGGPGTYQRKVYYGARPARRVESPRLFFATAALADQGNPAYRAWKLGLMQDAIENGGFDAVVLNHKLHQYRPADGPHWWGGAKAPDVEAFLALGDTLFSGPPASYDYPAYVAGFAAFATDLLAAGIDFAVIMPVFVFRAGGSYDDPSTPGVDEGELIRGAARSARWLLLQGSPHVVEPEWSAILADAASEGAIVVPFDPVCGFGGPDDPQTPPPDLSVSVLATPAVAATSSLAAGTLRVTPGGAATGSFDAELWCDCEAPPCGAPDAAATDIGGPAWDAPPGLCDSVYTGAAREYRPRARVTRGGFDAEQTGRVLTCRPGCSDGADNDRDGLADYPLDPGCADALAVFENPACSDGRDNDGDGVSDHPLDPGCASASDADERAAVLPCDDGRDNDGDGLADFGADPGCGGRSGIEDPPCDDDMDNDADGRIDWDGGPGGAPDPDCATASGRSERSGAGCGAGYELVVLLALPAARRARSARRRPSSRS